MKWAREHTSDRRTWPQSTRRTIEGGVVCVDGDGGKEARACECLRTELSSGRTKEGNAPEGTKEGVCSLSGGNVHGKGGGTLTCSQMCQGEGKWC